MQKNNPYRVFRIQLILQRKFLVHLFQTYAWVENKQVKKIIFFSLYLTKKFALKSQKNWESHSVSARSFSPVHSSKMIQIFWKSAYNLVLKELYWVQYHILLFVVVKIGNFSIDFRFYDILFFGIGSVFYVLFLQAQSRVHSKLDICPSTSKICKLVNFVIL